MIEFVSGDFFDFDADIMINTVNCVGVMGAGVALAFKKRFPEYWEADLAYEKGISDLNAHMTQLSGGSDQLYDAMKQFQKSLDPNSTNYAAYDAILQQMETMNASTKEDEFITFDSSTNRPRAMSVSSCTFSPSLINSL